jgi:DNA-directed RNA polymerase subunit RPC12/RpoP
MVRSRRRPMTASQQAKATRDGRLRAAGRSLDPLPPGPYKLSGGLLREYACGDCGRDLRKHEGPPLPDGYILFACHQQHCGFRRVLTRAEVAAITPDLSAAMPGGEGMELGELSRATGRTVIV